MGTHILPHCNLKFSPRTLAIFNAHVLLKGNHWEQTYEVKPNSLLSDQNPNMVVTLTIHITPKQANTIVPFVLVYLSTESILLSKNKILGF